MACESFILFCNCPCFSTEKLTLPLNDLSHEDHYNQWQKFLIEFKQELSKHRIFSIFNLSCGGKKYISVSVYVEFLSYAVKSFAVLKEIMDEKNLLNTYFVLDVASKPISIENFYKIFLDYCYNQIQLFSVLKTPADPLPIDILHKYFFIHQAILTLIYDCNDGFLGSLDEVLLRELEEFIDSSIGVGST